jgi:hypothetical protein
MGRRELVEALGYRNINRGLRRLDQLESGECVEPRFLERVWSVLQPDEAEIVAAINRDRAAREAWLDEPVPIRLAVKWAPGIFESVPLPEAIRHDPEAATALACEALRSKGRRFEGVEGWLTLDRRRTLLIDGTGHVLGCIEAGPGETVLPHLRVGGRALHLEDGEPWGREIDDARKEARCEPRRRRGS